MSEEINKYKVEAFDVKRELDVVEADYNELVKKLEGLKEIEAEKVKKEAIYNDLKAKYVSLIETILKLEKEELEKLKSTAEPQGEA